MSLFENVFYSKLYAVYVFLFVSVFIKHSFVDDWLFACSFGSFVRSLVVGWLCVPTLLNGIIESTSNVFWSEDDITISELFGYNFHGAAWTSIALLLYVYLTLIFRQRKISRQRNRHDNWQANKRIAVKYYYRAIFIRSTHHSTE